MLLVYSQMLNWASLKIFMNKLMQNLKLGLQGTIRDGTNSLYNLFKHNLVPSLTYHLNSNSQKKTLMPFSTYLLTLMLVINGPVVSQSKKFETNLLVVHVGLLVLLKPCQTEFVLHLIKSFKQEFPLKICWLVVDLAVVLVVTVVFQEVLGVFSRILVLLLVMNTIIILIAVLIALPHANIMLKDQSLLVEPVNLLLNVLKHAIPNMLLNTTKTR